MQHEYLLKTVYDGRLVYNKKVTLGPRSCVLDSGAGTGVQQLMTNVLVAIYFNDLSFRIGIWAIDLARKVPESVEIYAIDVTDAKYPSSESAPPNVHFSIASITALPKQWGERFDLINQRHLFAALLRTEWPKALSEMYRVLRPNGSVQLVELQIVSPLRTNAMHTARHQEYFKVAFDFLGLASDISERLPDLLANADFVDVVCEKKVIPVGAVWGDIGRQGSMANGPPMRSFGETFVQIGVFASTAEYDAHMDEMLKEWDEVGVEFLCSIICARKPMP